MNKIKRSGTRVETEDIRLSRRRFIKAGSVGAGLALLSGGDALGSSERKEEPLSIESCQDFPIEIRSDYRPFHQKNNIFMSVLTKPELGLREEIFKFHGPGKIKPDVPGFTQLDWALKEGGFALTEATTPGMPASLPCGGLNSWKQTTEAERKPFEFNYVSDNQYTFKSPREASTALKKAARLYGADLVGITCRDPRWDYSGFIDPIHKKQFGWEDFPFEPKTVIVLGFEMDYEAYTTAPSYVSEAATGVGYSEMSKTAYQVAVFLKLLGYHSVSTGNDVGLSVPYAIAAGLGEASRIGSVITPRFGPRVRLAKVYTDLDYVEYDKPIRFGAFEFCKRCKKCAQACPSKAITFQDEPDFEPSHGGPTWFNNTGTKKFYNNMLKCFKYWVELYAGCGACIAACPYSKPDFWHHRMVHEMTRLAPGPLHNVMNEMDSLFGYGNIFDREAVRRFWK